MNATLLIDAIVRQTTVLIATLATAAGHRAPLARVADQVFSDLVGELKEQGLGNKVIADMFGMALRALLRAHPNSVYGDRVNALMARLQAKSSNEGASPMKDTERGGNQ
jgi:hypothetical protein